MLSPLRHRRPVRAVMHPCQLGLSRAGNCGDLQVSEVTGHSDASVAASPASSSVVAEAVQALDEAVESLNRSAPGGGTPSVPRADARHVLRDGGPWP